MSDVTEVDVLSVEFPSSSETNKLIAIYIKRKQICEMTFQTLLWNSNLFRTGERDVALW